MASINKPVRRLAPLQSWRRRGNVLIWCTTALTVVFAFASLAMDYGRVQVAKTELRRAADAGARAGVSAVGSIGAVQDLAIAYASRNNCDGSPVLINRSDVEFGTWDRSGRIFTPLTGPARTNADALRVTCRRTGDNAIPLVFGRVLGQSFCNVQASSTVAIIAPGYGLVGLDSIQLRGNATASYWSSTGTVGGNQGNVASNGNITSIGNSMISGTVWKSPTATVTGVTANRTQILPAPLSYPNGDPGSVSATNNDNGLITGGGSFSTQWDYTLASDKTATFPAGKYYLRTFDIQAAATATFLGPATIYCYGSVLINGQAQTNMNLPKNLTIVMIPPPTGGTPGGVTIGGTADLYATIYAPQSPITVSGNGRIYGSVLGRSVNMSGTASIFYDLSFAGPGGVIQLVK